MGLHTVMCALQSNARWRSLPYARSQGCGPVLLTRARVRPRTVNCSPAAKNWSGSKTSKSRLSVSANILARAPRGLDAGAGRQHRIGRASGRHAGFRRSAIGEDFRTHESLWPFEALQHSLHARTRPPSMRHGRDRQLPASRLRTELAPPKRIRSGEGKEGLFESRRYSSRMLG